VEGAAGGGAANDSSYHETIQSSVYTFKWKLDGDSPFFSASIRNKSLTQLTAIKKL